MTNGELAQKILDDAKELFIDGYLGNAEYISLVEKVLDR